jgi:hypothetical protein
MSALIGDIFDLTQQIYKTIALAAKNAKKGPEYYDKLNYSAMIVDYGLGEVFAGILVATQTLQSANISLKSNGEIVMSGEQLTQKSIKNVAVNTPSGPIQQAAYVAQMVVGTGEMGLVLGNFIVDMAIYAETEKKEAAL